MVEPCRCPLSPCILPEEIYDAACAKERERVAEWLEAGNDVNASRNEWTLLSLGCLHNHVSLVQRLLHDPRLHLNVRTRGLTPFYLAAVYGHAECLRLMQGASLECQLDISASNEVNTDDSSTALMVSATLNHWESVEVILDSRHNLKEDEMNHTLDKALCQNRWNVVWKILRRNHDFDKERLGEILQAACAEESWDVISEILGKGVRVKNMRVGDMLFNRVRCRDWLNAAPLLSLLSSQAALDTTLSEAVLKDGTEITDHFLEEENVYISEREKIVENLLNDDDYKSSHLDAALLVAAVGGTCEAVARLLLNRHRSKDKNVIINALLLASKHNRLELLPDLLACHSEDYTYKVLSQARHIAAKNQNLDAAKLIFRALEIKTKEILA
ncbi:uncharacterized protein LOC135212001 [Macrobrachium nipponense]|uniref:uncharacterized protein LOC135212001 n=1 Tax=Macrobrachium nipponense TaxID=159736 RepID=UPI0030C86D92